MADLKVDGAGLQDLLSGLRSFADNMQEATSSLESAQASGLGNRDLESAADHFAGEWAYGIGQLREASTTVAQQLEDGLRSYSDCDAQLADEIRKAMTKS
jgi:phosphate uptake regulator